MGAALARAASVAAIAALCLGPIAALLAQVTPAALDEALGAASFPKALANTLISGAGGSVLSLAIGTVFAREFALAEWRGKRLQRLLLLLPYLVPNFILASAYVLAWNPGTGLLNGWLPFPGGLYGLPGMVALFGVAHAPVAFLLIEEKLRRVDPALREAARLSGAGPARVFLLVDLPLTLPTLLSAFSLCFALSIAAFAIPAWIGAPERAYTLAYKIYQAIQVGGQDGMPQAAAISAVLFALALPPLLLVRRAARAEKRLATVGGKASRRSDRPPRPLAFAAFQALFLLVQLVSWALPLGALAVSTLVKPGCLQSQGLACLNDPSLRSYRYVLFELAETRHALEGSFLYGGIAALLVTALSIGLLALVSGRGARGRTAAALDWTLSIPVATPGAIIALGLIVTASGRFGFSLYNTPWIVVVAFVIKHLSLGFQPLRTGLAGISGSLFEAARLSGARSWQTWRHIALPILKPEVLGGFLLVLIPVLGELTMSVFLSSPSFRSIGTVLFDLQDYADQASAAALSVLLVALVLALNEAARLLSRGKLGY